MIKVRGLQVNQQTTCTCDVTVPAQGFLISPQRKHRAFPSCLLASCLAPSSWHPHLDDPNGRSRTFGWITEELSALSTAAIRYRAYSSRKSSTTIQQIPPSSVGLFASDLASNKLTIAIVVRARTVVLASLTDYSHTLPVFTFISYGPLSQRVSSNS